jgi:hypothetical protein
MTCYEGKYSASLTLGRHAHLSAQMMEQFNAYLFF